MFEILKLRICQPWFRISIFGFRILNTLKIKIFKEDI
jgi:hypothetical protein